jgi:hypothetical protein
LLLIASGSTLTTRDMTQDVGKRRDADPRSTFKFSKFTRYFDAQKTILRFSFLFRSTGIFPWTGEGGINCILDDIFIMNLMVYDCSS